jgi:predicted glycogen debranching enzyme
MPSVRPPVVAVRPAGGAIRNDAEWLLTDGAGGYASGCADDLARRRYHAWWIARPANSARRFVAVAAIDERVLVGGAVHHLMHAHWRDLPQPTPPAIVPTFVRRPLPAWTFRSGEITIERTIALRRVRAEAGSAPCLLVRWRNLSAVPVRLDLRPLLGYCDADHLPPADERADATVLARGASWGFRPNTLLPAVWLTADGVAAFRGEAAWYRGFLYATDRDRGYDHVGDRWTPGVLELEIGAGRDATLAFALDEPCAAPAAAFAAVARDAAAACERDVPGNDCHRRLELGADDFLYRAAGNRLGVLAGFPWFGEWGRDVFVSLPGLTLARGRFDLCAEVLRGAVPFLRGGLLPNVYGTSQGDSHYDSCDAALWFALAVARFADAGGEREVVARELVPALAAIAAAYERGTDLGLVVGKDGLLCAGRDDLNATWMDARIGKVPVTPRAGLPVEIEALWYSLLAFLAEHAATDKARWQTARDRCGRAFVQQFWLAANGDDGGWLADRVDDGVPDRAVRPNMVIAAALPRSPLSPAQRAAVVQKARGELLTPVGLRTLSPLDPAYRGRYEGGTETRDRAYHQGTVWPWLGGFFVEAALAAVPKKARAEAAVQLRGWLDGFLPELDRAGLDHVSEVFDGDPPHRPGGTFAQAWNTGELLRAQVLVAEARA